MDEVEAKRLAERARVAGYDAVAYTTTRPGSCRVSLAAAGEVWHFRGASGKRDLLAFLRAGR